jgi:hypothetical protein
MRRLSVVFVCLFLSPAWAGEAFRYPEGKHGKGELKYVNGVPVLSVEGTPEEIGEAIGVLAIKPVKHLEGLFLKFLRRQGLDKILPLFAKTCEGMLAKMPAAYRRELDAMAKASGFKRDMLVIANCYIDLAKVGGCSTVVVEPARSVSGNLLFGRNLDLPPLDRLNEFSLVTVYRPKGKRAFAAIGYPGLIAGTSSMNDAGLCLATNEILASADGAPRFDPKGEPMLAAFRRVNEECGTLTEVEKLAKTYHYTTMGSLTICDEKSGMVIEVTPKSVGIRKAEKGLCFCTNHLRCEGLAVKEECWRWDELEKSRKREKWALADLAKQMNVVNQGVCTMQTIVFEPAVRTLHISFGKPPSSAHPLKKVDIGPLLKGK